MVGRQTSRGCATCRKRKIKCDLTTPACLGCLKADWACPGYPARFVSLSNNSRLLARCDNDAESLRFVSYTDGFALPPTLSSKADQLRTNFVMKLEADLLAAQLTMMPAGHILKHIPCRIGSSEALDDAVRCITETPLRLVGDKYVRSGELYVRALKSLRMALDDPIKMTQSETLAAAALLQMFEQYIDGPSTTWMQHARGVVKMLKLRGASNLTGPVERAILEAQAGHVFMSALAANQDSFLADPAWYQVVRPPTEKVVSNRWIDMFMGMVMDGVRTPHIDDFCNGMVQDCKYSASVSRERRERLTHIAICDIERMRQQLARRLDNSPQLLPTPGAYAESRVTEALTTAAYAATGLFLILSDTIILSMLRQLRRGTAAKAPSLPFGLTEALLTAERAATLDLVTMRFQLLAEVDPQVHLSAVLALRVSFSTILSMNADKKSEAEVLLHVLDNELEESCVKYAAPAIVITR